MTANTMHFQCAHCGSPVAILESHMSVCQNVACGYETFFEAACAALAIIEVSDPLQAQHVTYGEAQIATLDGEPVFGSHANGEPFWVKVEWAGLKIGTDGETLNFDTTTGGCVGDMSIAEWGKLIEVMQARVVDRLLIVAQAFMTGNSVARRLAA